MNRLIRKKLHDWFQEKTYEKTEFVLNQLGTQIPFTTGYIGFVLIAGKRIIRHRKSGVLEIIFRKKLPVTTLYSVRIFLDIAKPICYRHKNRYYVRYLLPFIYSAFLTRSAQQIFPTLLKENIEIFRGTITAIIDQYGKIETKRKKQMIFRIPNPEIRKVVKDKIEIDRVVTKLHHKLRYTYFMIKNRRKLLKILNLIKPRNPSIILTRALIMDIIGEKEAKDIEERIKKAVEELPKIYTKKKTHPTMTITKPSEIERTYVLGFAVGDLSVEKKGNKVGIRFGTTHPEAILLFHRMLGKYGKIFHYVQRHRNRDEVEVHLKTYIPYEYWSILLEKDNLDVIKREISDEEKLKQFLAGLFDAEGTIIITRDNRTEKTVIVTRIAMNNVELLRYLKQRLEDLGIKSHLRKDKNREYYRLITTERQAIKFLETIPIRHTEKTRKAKIALEYYKKPWMITKKRLEEYRREIINKREQLQKLARIQLK